MAGEEKSKIDTQEKAEEKENPASLNEDEIENLKHLVFYIRDCIIPRI